MRSNHLSALVVVAPSLPKLRGGDKPAGRIPRKAKAFSVAATVTLCPLPKSLSFLDNVLADFGPSRSSMILPGLTIIGACNLVNTTGCPVRCEQTGFEKTQRSSNPSRAAKQCGLCGASTRVGEPQTFPRVRPAQTSLWWAKLHDPVSIRRLFSAGLCSRFSKFRFDTRRSVRER